MFTSRKRLKRKTPANGIDRKDFIGLLVDEYYETTDVEAKEQVTANLANFAYDPINYDFLRESSAIELFIELLSSVNSRLVRHGISGICNLCLDPKNRSTIVELSGIQLISLLLRHSEVDIVQKAIATFIQLDNEDVRLLIYSAENISAVKLAEENPFVPLKNVATLFLEELANN